MSFVEEQQVKALAELFPVYGNNIDEKVTNKIVSDTIIATAKWANKMLKDYGLDDEFTDNEIAGLIKQAKESK